VLLRILKSGLDSEAKYDSKPKFDSGERISEAEDGSQILRHPLMLMCCGHWLPGFVFARLCH
jgi:hypothetical protein